MAADGRIAEGLVQGSPGRERIRLVVELAHRHLRLDAAFATELVDGRVTVHALAGDAASFEAGPGVGPALVELLTARMVAGEIPGVVGDVGVDPAVRDLAPPEAKLGAFIGVPLRLPGGAVYGGLSCLGHEPDPSLAERDVRFLQLLADVLADDLSEMRRQDRQRDQLEELIAVGDLRVAYQPVIDVRDDSVLGLEALSRFPPPLRPDEAFAAAHRFGLGVLLERAAISRAVSVLPSLGAGQFLSINVSPEAAPQVARGVRSLPEESLRRLVLEVTEHTAVESYAALRAELTELRSRGMRLAIDDAGAGYASLRHVVELRPEFIKIDRSLVDGVSADHARRVAIGSFVLLALDLGATIVAEGVEEADDLSALQDLGVDAVQGFLLARPSSDPEEITAWTRRARPAGPAPGRPDRLPVGLTGRPPG